MNFDNNSTESLIMLYRIIQNDFRRIIVLDEFSSQSSLAGNTPNCSGSGTKSFYRCGGSGQRGNKECVSCDGSGKKICSSCGGTGIEGHR